MDIRYTTHTKKCGGEIRIVSCWTHTRWKFADLVKSLDGKNAKAVIAAGAMKKIQVIYHADIMMKDAPADERLKHRQYSVKPLVDAYFAWLDDPNLTLGMDKSSKRYLAIQYSRNLEQFLRTFLTDGNISLDNNDAERSIRAFLLENTTGIFLIRRPDPRPAVYSTVLQRLPKPMSETVRILHLCTLHAYDDVSSYISDLVSWAENIPDYCKNMNT